MPVLSDAELRVVAEVVTELAKYLAPRPTRPLSEPLMIGFELWDMGWRASDR
jgi:hypothetical protein